MNLRLTLLLLLPLTIMTVIAKADDADDKIAEARAALKTGDAEKALKAAEEAVKLAPSNASAHFYRGEALGAQRKSTEAIECFNKVLQLDPKMAIAIDRRGGEMFKLGKIKESIEDFDAYIKANPKAEEAHWRRGISYYYAGRFDDGAKQFELGKIVYGADVENAFWHYICVVRKHGIEKGRKELLKVNTDKRVPMMKIYDLIQGKATAADVVKTAEDAKLEGEDKTEARFYAHLYVALNYEAEGDTKKALEHMELAHKQKIGHYMWDVANTHLMLAKKK